MAEDTVHVLRVEGVNFDATLLDTQDISTIRGAGLTLLDLPDAVARGLDSGQITPITTLLSGASQFACTFRARPEQAASIRRDVAVAVAQRGPGAWPEQRAPFDHLSCVVDTVPGDDQAAVTRAEARNKARQFRQWTLPLPALAEGSKGYDPWDRARPANTTVRLPSGKLPNRPGTEDGPAQLSASTAERHAFGRAMRRDFYRRELGDGPFKALGEPEFSDSFQDMVDAPPDSPGHRLPLSLRSAMAVFYADGNGFGDIVRCVGPVRFSARVRALRQELLHRTLQWFCTGRDRAHPAFVIHRAGIPRLRFETLLWGGDEVTFVMPAWLALDFAEAFFAATAGWDVDGHRLTHSAGLVICHCKTPIRLARGIAHDLADDIKEAVREHNEIARNSNPPGRKMPLGNAIGMEVFEGLMPPLDGPGPFRRRLYGGADDPLAMALPDDGLAALRAHCRAILADADTALPRSQLNRILRAVHAAYPDLTAKAACTCAATLIRNFQNRVGRGPKTPPSLPHLDGIKGRSAALDLALIDRWLDYAAAFADPLPPFPTGDPT